MATYAKALRMNVIAWSQNLTAGTCGRGRRGAGVEGRADGDADAISIHMVLSDRSRGLVGQPDIARMKRGAILVNTSRGPIVDEAAMLEALQAGRIVAALDVYDSEPLSVDHPLRKRAEHRFEPAFRVLREGNLGRVLSADDRERAGVSWMASRCG